MVRVTLRPTVFSTRYGLLNIRASSKAITSNKHQRNRIYVIPAVLHQTLYSSSLNCNKMVDPKRVVSYEDMLKVIQQPEKVIIDVRNQDEVNDTGKIPSSINIPLNSVQEALSSMSNEQFKHQYQRNKPTSSDELIFYCQAGRRSSEALDKALKLGYSNSKTYVGSWNDWSSRQK